MDFHCKSFFFPGGNYKGWGKGTQRPVLRTKVPKNNTMNEGMRATLRHVLRLKLASCPYSVMFSKLFSLSIVCESVTKPDLNS